MPSSQLRDSREGPLSEVKNVQVFSHPQPLHFGHDGTHTVIDRRQHGGHDTGGPRGKSEKRSTYPGGACMG